MPVVSVLVDKIHAPASFSAALRELCLSISSFSNVQMSAEECEALAIAAIGGHAQSEFMIGSVFDAAGDLVRAMHWYARSASRDYLPATLQLFAIR